MKETGRVEKEGRGWGERGGGETGVEELGGGKGRG